MTRCRPEEVAEVLDVMPDLACTCITMIVVTREIGSAGPVIFVERLDCRTAPLLGAMESHGLAELGALRIAIASLLRG